MKNKKMVLIISGLLVLALFAGVTSSVYAFGGRDGERPHAPRRGDILEKLGMTKEELEARLDEGETFHDILLDSGLELPLMLVEMEVLETLGLTPEEFKARIDTGETMQEIADDLGVELPVRGERPEQPERPDRQDRPERPECTQDCLDQQDRPDRQTQPERPEQPEQGQGRGGRNS